MNDYGESTPSSAGITQPQDLARRTDDINARCQIDLYDGQKVNETAETILSIHNKVFPQSLDEYRVVEGDQPQEIARKQRIFEIDRRIKIRQIVNFITNPRSSLVLCRDPEAGKVIGYSLAVPVGLADLKRSDESQETAYIFNTEFLQEYQGHGLVGKALPALEIDMKKKGYSFFERDVRMENGYHKKVEKNYGDRIVAKSGPHDSWIGPQMFYRIRL